jgi:TolB-like protein
VLVTGAAPRSIAVLPFENLGNSPTDHVISLGVPEAVLHLLASLNEVVVIARTSSFAYQGDRDARSIGQALNARYLLEGSVQSADGRVRVTARLIDAHSNADIWSVRFDRAREDVFALQDEIATQVAHALKVSLDRSSNTRLVCEGGRLPLARSGGRRASDRSSSDMFPVLALTLPLPY